MNFFSYLEASKVLAEASLADAVTEDLMTKFAVLMARGHSVADLVAHYGDEFGHLPAQRLRFLARHHRQWKAWQKRLQLLKKTRDEAKLPPLPMAFLQHATSPDQLDAVMRTSRACPEDVAGGETAWLEHLRAGAELWTKCLAVTRKAGQIHCKLSQENHPGAAHYDVYLNTKTEIENLAPHRWLAMRRGEAEGVLTLGLIAPRPQLIEQVELLRSRLGPAVVGRDVSSLLEELVTDDLAVGLFAILDQEAESKAIETACKSLSGVLLREGLSVDKLGSVYLSRARTTGAAVVVDGEGSLRANKAFRSEEGFSNAVVELFAKEGVSNVVLPARVADSQLLQQLEEALHGAALQTIKIRTAALGEARQPLVDPPERLSSAVASAVVLARRALDPLKAWSAVDPVAIGIAEYQHDLNEERLRAALTEVAELCRLERRRGQAKSMGSPVARGGVTMARLNPLVKSMSDLRPGMSVVGVVSNISHFGAFVNIGLPQEGLVHVSELSDDFVENPNEVVSIGQQVTAYVLAVDTKRRRISLSCKKPKENSRGEAEWRPKRAVKAGRADALANLERLFKK